MSQPPLTKRQGNVWATAPSMDYPPVITFHDELDWKENGGLGGRPSLLASRSLPFIEDIFRRYVVFPIHTPENSFSVPKYAVPFTRGDKGFLKKGNVLTSQPFAFSSASLHTYLDDLTYNFLSCLKCFKQYLDSQGGAFPSGSIVKLSYVNPGYALVLSGAPHPLKLISVIRSCKPYQPEDDCDPLVYTVSKESVVFTDSLSSQFPDKVSFNLLIVRTVSRNAISCKFGSLKDNGASLSARFSKLF